MQTQYYFKIIHSPVGEIKLVASNNGLAAILWEDDDPKRVQVRKYTEKNDHQILVETEQQLREYFNGERKEFSIALDFIGTDFQKQVWYALLTIPYGETRTYGQIADQLNNPKAVRAVGAANGRNPISIIAPCHRVIGASGSLTGFAGGLENKAILLKIENGKIGFKPQLEIF
jgi:methylated-DNA-[protein]-cysteine S-methyltransferase